MPSLKLYSKKILLVLVVFFCFASTSFSGSIEDKKSKINLKLENIFVKLNSRSFAEQIEFYKIFKTIVGEKKIIIKDKKKLELISYIENKFDNKYSEYKKQYTKGGSPLLTIKKHSTLILKFTRGANHSSIINKSIEKIKKTGSVFLFKKGSDLSRKDIKTITTEIKKLNKNILFFIDQEGGWINRYIEFEKASDVNQYFSDNTIDKKIRGIFPAKYGYFPSLKRIGTFYDSFKNDSEKKYFLEKIAYIRLQSLNNNGVNTYGLVLDLDRGNPVISGYSRSFSKHIDKYKLLVNAFTKASQKTGVTLYFKHFPGHGTGKIDSHKGILNLIGQEKYLKENLELFNYALEKNTKSGIMVAHAYLANSQLTQFNAGIQKASFLLTDDLAMQGYKLSHNKKKNNMFFTTDSILKSNKLIKVDSIHVSGVK